MASTRRRWAPARAQGLSEDHDDDAGAALRIVLPEVLGERYAHVVGAAWSALLRRTDRALDRRSAGCCIRRGAVALMR